MKKIYGALLALVLLVGSGAAFAAPPSPNPEPCQQGKAGQHNKHCDEQPPPSTCTDGIDNDEDGLADADDPECQDPNDGVEDGSDEPAGSCSDGIDNDEDGLADADDPECQDPEDGEEDGSDVTLGSCEDGIDNDEDGLTDADDPECQDPEDGEEDGSDVTPDPTCASGGLLGPGTILNSDRNEDGPVSGTIHGDVEPLVPSPVKNAAHEAGCAVITVEDLLP